MPANETWGVTSATTSAYLAQYTHNSDAYPVDTTDYPTLLALAAARVNGYVVGAGFTLSDIADDATTVAYLRCQDWTARLTAAHVLRSSVGADPLLAERLEEGVLAELKALLDTPAILGADAEDGGVRGDVSTPVDRLSLDTSSTARNSRRYWDNVTDRTSGTDDPRRW